MMGRVLGILVLTGTSLLLGTPAGGTQEIVIAIRYLQAEGTSHSHLYLYREDGRPLRQLTNDNSGQDSAPIFAPDGANIVFTREKPNNVREFWSVDPLGKTLKKLEAAPDWYVAAKSSPYFTNVEPEESASPDPSASAAESISPTATPIPTYKSPDGSIELILRDDPNDENDQIDGPGHGKHYLLRDLKNGVETEFGKVPGFDGVFGLLHDNQDKNQHFLFEGPLRLAFFDCI
jgi:Periplasmic component of the Tol biopolymer transport system